MGSQKTGKTGSLLVVAEEPGDRERAEKLADHLRTVVIGQLPKDTEGVLFLRYCREGLTLTDGKLSLRGDFSALTRRLKRNNLTGEMLVRAAKMRKKEEEDARTALDATAGLGEDSLLLAAAGFSVDLYEQDPVIAALLADTLMRARESEDSLLCAAACRMHLHEADSIPALRGVNCHPDLVVLDPMFPERKKSALIGKKFQLLQQLERPCSNERELLDAARAAHPEKIVIKRPLKGPYLAGEKPDYSLFGRAIRYDCLVFPD